MPSGSGVSRGEGWNSNRGHGVLGMPVSTQVGGREGDSWRPSQRSAAQQQHRKCREQTAIRQRCDVGSGLTVQEARGGCSSGEGLSQSCAPGRTTSKKERLHQGVAAASTGDLEHCSRRSASRWNNLTCPGWPPSRCVARDARPEAWVLAGITGPARNIRTVVCPPTGTRSSS